MRLCAGFADLCSTYVFLLNVFVLLVGPPTRTFNRISVHLRKARQLPNGKTSEASALQNEECIPKSQKHTFQGFYTIACLKNMGVIETARDIARQYFDKQSLGRRRE
jgi:hypothetical protein